MAAFPKGSVVLPIFCCCSAGRDCPVVTQSEPGKPPRIDPGSFSLSLSVPLVFLNVPFVEQEQGSDSDCSTWGYADISWSSEHREMQSLAAPSGALGALCWLLCCGFPPWCLACLGPSRASQPFSGFASAQPWWLLPC